MQSRLHIDLYRGIIDVEGEESFVREIYADYKDRLKDLADVGAPKAPEPIAELAGEKIKSKPRRAATKKSPKTKTDGEAKASAYRPALTKDLDTSGLAAFYKQFSPKNNAEKILVFVKFLEEKLDISPCSADQIYTCYRSLKQSVPQHFRQVIVNTSGRDYGYIEYGGIDEITASIIGQNYFDDGLVRASDE